MKKIFKGIAIIIYILVLGSVILFNDEINSFIINNFIYKKEIKQLDRNEYSRQLSFDYLKITEDFETNNLTDVINNIYTIIDSGVEDYSFYCSSEYETCIDDVKLLSDNSSLLTLLNNFVHPYNSFDKLYITTNSMGKITISIDKLYSDADIAYVNENMDRIIAEVIKDDMSIREKIRAIHDYLINTTVYDEEKSNEIKENIYSSNVNHSHKATGLYSNHLALCSGYTDTMAIYLNRFGLKNYKISTDDHIWNAIYLEEEDKWVHLDLTWDDPVTSDKSNVLIHDFFLIDDLTLTSKHTAQHVYNTKIYTEIATVQ